MTRRDTLRVLPVSAALIVSAQSKYSGPRPPKKDIPYLLQAQKLIETEVQQATTSTTKDGTTYSVAGATSPARTPLPEPVFLFLSDKISPEKFRVYHFETQEGRRQVTLAKHRSEDDQEEDLRIALRPLDVSLYRIEATHMLNPGEYALSPEGLNSAFCFTVY